MKTETFEAALKIHNEIKSLELKREKALTKINTDSEFFQGLTEQEVSDLINGIRSLLNAIYAPKIKSLVKICWTYSVTIKNSFMGDNADGILNGDFDEHTGEYIGEGQEFPRSMHREQRENYDARMKSIEPLVEKIIKRLEDNGFIVSLQKKLDYGIQLKLSTGGIVNIYTSGKINLQGKPDDKLDKLF